VALSRAVLDQQIWTGQLTRAQLVYSVESSYLTIAWTEGQSELDRKIIEDLEKLQSFLKEQVRLHLELPSNLAALEQETAAAKLHLSETETLLGSSRMQLSRLIGRTDKEAMRLAKVKAVALPPIADLYAQILGKHPQVHVQQTTADQAKQLYRIARAAQLPTVGLQTGWTRADDLVHQEQDLWYGGLIVSVPIFDFGGLSAATKQAEETWKAETARTQQAKDDVFNAMAADYSQIHQFELIVVTTERQIADAEANLKVLRAQQEQGILTAQPVAQAELQLLGLKEVRDVNEFKSRLYYAALNLATGGNWKWAQ
jgi:outer membrane protein TolC